jgi:hypothetical protein
MILGSASVVRVLQVAFWHPTLIGSVLAQKLFPLHQMELFLVEAWMLALTQ